MSKFDNLLVRENYLVLLNELDETDGLRLYPFFTRALTRRKYYYSYFQELLRYFRECYSYFREYHSYFIELLYLFSGIIISIFWNYYIYFLFNTKQFCLFLRSPNVYLHLIAHSTKRLFYKRHTHTYIFLIVILIFETLRCTTFLSTS
jgi:hypothetical protein